MVMLILIGENHLQLLLAYMELEEIKQKELDQDFKARRKLEVIYLE
jgi:hypothetical protein